VRGVRRSRSTFWEDLDSIVGAERFRILHHLRDNRIKELNYINE
jgi:hypothetical protein